MKYRLFPLFLLSLVLLSFQCNKDATDDNPLDENYFVFGYHNGFCIGGDACSQLFLLQDGKIYADDLERFTGTLAFKSVPLSAEKYAIALPAKEQFPAILLQTPNQTFGCPGCVDQGNIYIAQRINGELVWWDLDPDTSALPDHLKAYATLIFQIVQELTQ